MDEKKYDGDYLNISLAISVLGVGMLLIAVFSMGSPGAVQLLIGGALIGYYGAGRLHVYNRSGNHTKGK